ncbi:MAG TPA: O-antigen ligase family protein [Chthoniobacterales bacterium]|jgi:hypothetical protein
MDALTPRSVWHALVAAVGLCFAVFVGLMIPGLSLSDIAPIAAVILSLIYFSGGHKYTWRLGFFLSFLSLNLYVGFSIGDLQQTCLLAGMFILTVFWRKQNYAEVPLAKTSLSYSVFRHFLALWCLYIAFHAMFHLNAQEGLRNILKSYFDAFAPYLLLLYFLRVRPKNFELSKNILNFLSLAVLFALLLNIPLRVASAFREVPYDMWDSAPVGFLIYPFLQDNVYSLRTIAPFGCLLASVLLVNPYRIKMKPEQSFATGMLFLLSILGGVFSGGRATLSICFGVLGLVLLWAKSYLKIFAAAILVLLLALCVNTFNSQINQRAPLLIKRSVQWLLINKDNEASGHISGSSQWRTQLFHRAVQEWKSTAWTTAFGRGFPNLMISDYAVTRDTDINELALEFTLVRGKTHNQISDLLLAFGLVGLLLWYGMMFALVFWLISLLKKKSLSPSSRTFFLIVLMHLVVNTTLGLFGGGSLTGLTFWLIIAVMYTLLKESEKISLTETATIAGIASQPELPRRSHRSFHNPR